MAGSFGHITDDEAHFIGMRLIENLGDAHEALEECYGMIWWLANEVAGYYHDQDEPTRDEALAFVRMAQENHEEGLEIGKG